MFTKSTRSFTPAASNWACMVLVLYPDECPLLFNHAMLWPLVTFCSTRDSLANLVYASSKLRLLLYVCSQWL